MKILLATGIFPPEIGGPASSSKYLAREFVKRGHEVELITYGDHKTAEVNLDANFKTYVVSKNNPKGLRHFAYFLKVYYLSKTADVVLLFDSISAGVPVYYASKLSGVPYILKVPGDYVWEQSFQRWGVKELLDDFLKKAYGAKIERMRKIQSKVAKNAKHIIVPSNYLYGVVQKWGVLKEKISVIYNSISEPKNSFSKSQARAKLGVLSDEIILFSAGRSVPWKSYEIFREMMPEIKERFPKVRFVSGSFPKNEYDLWLAAADVYLYNTAYEGFSHQVLEVMAFGPPLITTEAGGNREIVKNGENALICGYNNKEEWKSVIMKLLGDQELQKRLLENAQITAKSFMGKDMAGEMLRVLESNRK